MEKTEINHCTSSEKVKQLIISIRHYILHKSYNITGSSYRIIRCN